MGVAYIALLLAPGKGSFKHLCLKCQQLGLCLHHLRIAWNCVSYNWFGLCPIQAGKCYFPVEIVLYPRGLLRRSIFANSRAKSGMSLLPCNKILSPLFALFLTFTPSLLFWVLVTDIWYRLFSCILLGSQIRDSLFFFFFLHYVITESILFSRYRNEN